MTTTPKLEIVVVRDPDGPIWVHLFLNGVEIAETDDIEYIVDAGAGHTTEDWIQRRNDAVAAASPAVAQRLHLEFNDPPGAGEIIGGWPPDGR